MAQPRDVFLLAQWMYRGNIPRVSYLDSHEPGSIVL